MYNPGELKFKSNISYTEMTMVAMQYSKNVMGAALDEGVVFKDFMRISAYLYTFCDIKDKTVNADEVMAAVYAYGYARYLKYMSDHSPLGQEYFNAFSRMLDNADKVADKRQPVDKLLDSLIALGDNMTEFIKPGEDGTSPITGVLTAIKEMASNGEAMPPK